MGFGAYSTPPISTNVATALAEGVLPPFPEHEEVTGSDQKLSPVWRRWFTRQQTWLVGRGAYTPTGITFSGLGTAAVSGTPVFQWWKQGNIVQVYLDLQLTTVSTGGGSVTIKPLPFDPTIRILQTGRTTAPLFIPACMTYNGTVWSATPAFCFNGKAGSNGTYIQLLNVPVSTTFIDLSGTYITDN